MSSEIIDLPPEVVRKIAAGEVITRPVNIIKELVENSIDAGSTKISVLFENGGISRIRVRDNGSGIHSSELFKAFQLHSTSKVKEGDIYRISTLGFRGEALASIAAVAKIRCKSRHKDEDMGKMIVLEDSKLITERDVKLRNPGTEIEVLGLFYNVPARRKFLKSPATEKKVILDFLTHLCITYHEIHFIVQEQKGTKKTVLLESPPREEMLTAIYDILGAKVGKELVDVSGMAGRWEVRGYVSKPILTRKDRNLQFVRVNGRAVKQVEIQKAVEEAYGSRLMKQQHPVIVIDLKGNVDWVDFNVHPQKTEIRFQQDDTVLEDLRGLIEQKLTSSAELPLLDSPPDVAEAPPSVPPEEVTGQGMTPGLKEDDVLDSLPKQTTLDEFIGRKEDVTRSSRGYKVLGQVMQKFALIDAGRELWVMDIHASDERVKFEMYQSESQKLIMSQGLLSPLSIQLEHGLHDLIAENMDVFKKYGMEISLSDSECHIHSLPVYFDQEITEETIKEFFYDIASSLTDGGDAQIVKTPLDKLEYYIVSRLACHGAIRSGYFVDRETIGRVLDQLLECDNPWTCAHGRPTVIRFTKNKLDSLFRR